MTGTRQLPSLAIVAVVAFGIFWGIFTFRIEPLMLTVLLVLALLWRRVRRSPWVLGLFAIAIFTVALSPYGVTFRSVVGHPRFVGCCCCIPGDLARTQSAQARSECVVCSDVVNGFEPKWYWVW
jgi:hypothetical protein